MSVDKIIDIALDPLGLRDVIKGFISPKTPRLPPAPPAPPTRDDPAIAAAGKKQQAADLRRRGRRSTIITGGQGVLGGTPLSQPRAGAATLG